MLDIRENEKDGCLCVNVAGRLDSTTAPKFQKELESRMDSAESLVIDMEDLEYISSAGLRVLLVAQKTMDPKGGMKLLHVNENILDIFELTGCSDILTIE